MTSNYYLYRH